MSPPSKVTVISSRLLIDVYKRQGFMGAHGRGTAAFCGVIGRVDIITGTFGKAMGGEMCIRDRTTGP